MGIIFNDITITDLELVNYECLSILLYKHFHLTDGRETFGIVLYRMTYDSC